MNEEDEVEHQATVDRGLKMRIKRKQTAKTDSRTKQGSNDDPSSSSSSSARTHPQRNPATAFDPEDESRQDEEEDPDGSGGGGGGGSSFQQRTLKRKRRNGNNKSGKQRDSESDDRTGGDVEDGGQNTGRDLCHVNSGRKVGFVGCGVRRRTMVSCQQTIDDHPSGRQEVETMESAFNSETSDDPNRESSERELLGIGCSDVQMDEFLTKSEDQKTQSKKFKGSQMDSSEMLTSSSSSSCTLSSKTKCSVGSVTCSVGVMTDPDCLGPCEPGTSVILEGIVWSESNNGILVVNVTWRGKTYVGTLMDATKHHWASPRFREESPTADLEYKAPKSKRGTPVTDVTTDRTERRRPRKCRRTASTAAAAAAAATGTPPPPRQSPPIALVESIGRCTKGRGTDSEAEATTALPPAASRRARVEPDDDDTEPLYKCMTTECNKKFKHISGLRYHQSQAHRKQSAALTRRTNCPPPEKERTERRKEEEEEEDEEEEQEEPPEKLPGAGLALGYEVGSDVIADGNSEILVKETTGNSETVPVGGATNPDGKVEEMVRLPGDDCNSSFHGTASSSTAAPEETVESNETAESVNESTQRPSTGSAVEVLREEMMTSNEYVRVCPKVMTPDFQNSAKHLGSGSVNSVMAFDARKVPNNAAVELDFDRPDRDLVKSPSTAVDLFHKPLLRTPDAGKQHRAEPQPSDKHFPSIRPDGGQPPAPSSVSCPPSVGVRPPPCTASNGGGEDKRSPVFSSDISDGSSNENELRLRRAEKDSRRIPRTEKSFVVPRRDDCSSGGASCLQSNARLSPFPSLVASSQNPSCLPVNRKSVEPVRPPRGTESEQVRKVPGLPPLPKTPVSLANPSSAPLQATADRCRSSDRSAVDPTAQENGLLWIEMLQRANMIPFGYGVDPVAHMQLMTSNADYRNHYERWYMGQQCYRQQLLQAEKDKCDKPVDMSAKTNAVSSAVANNVAHDSKATTNFKLHSKPISGSIVEDQPLSAAAAASDKHRNPVVGGGGGGMMSSPNYPSSSRSVTMHSHHHHHHHHEKSVLPRSKPPVVPKQESVLLRGTTAERDEKPLDLINPQSAVNKAKSKQPLDGPNFSSGSSNHSAVKSKGSVAGQLQDFPKASLATQVRYEGGFPSQFSGFQCSTYLDSSSLATSGNRYPVVSGKYSPTTGNEKATAGCSTGQARKTDPPSTPLHSAKDLLLGSPAAAEKSVDGVRRQNADSFEFADSLGSSSAQDKPPATGHNSPLTLRHLHTHHHTHVVGAAPYSIYGSYSGLMSPVPTIVPSVVPVIPPTYIPK